MEATLTERPVATLLSDAAMFARLSKNSELGHDIPASASYARASILNSVFAVECGVNLLLEETIRSSRLRNGLDRLPTLTKAEALVHYVDQQADFDRGTTPVQCMQEMINLRNSLVHPKVQKSSLSGDVSDGMFQFVETRTIEKTNILDIPKDSRSWGFDEAARALQAADEFLEFLLLDLCSLATSETQYILLGKMDLDPVGKTIGIGASEIATLIDSRDTLSVGFRYLDLDSILAQL